MKGLSRLLAVCLLVAALVTLVAAAGVAQSPGGVLTVGPGESIQAAVNAADPGDTVTVLPGTYRQSVVIRKDNIRLVGVRATLRPPARNTSPCGPSGICILGRVDFDTGEVARYVSNVTVSGFTVQNNSRACAGDAEEGVPPISGVGVALLGARGVEVRGNDITGNAPTGPSAFSGGVVVVRGLGGTPPANNAVIGNRILNNDPDIFWDRSGTNNRFSGNNCRTSVPARLCRG
jgi:nitrous oxidase accessory protein NosD